MATTCASCNGAEMFPCVTCRGDLSGVGPASREPETGMICRTCFGWGFTNCTLCRPPIQTMEDPKRQYTLFDVHMQVEERLIA